MFKSLTFLFFLISLPDACPFEMASLAEPLSVLIHASRRCSLSANQNVLVCGLGAIGLLACALSKHMGAKRVVAVDINPERVEFAKQHGFADEAFCPPTPPSPTPSPSTTTTSSSSAPSADSCCPHPHHSSQPVMTPTMMSEEQIKKAQMTAQTVKDTFNDLDGYDVVFECTGVESVIQMGVFVSFNHILSKSCLIVPCRLP